MKIYTANQQNFEIYKNLDLENRLLQIERGVFLIPSLCLLQRALCRPLKITAKVCSIVGI